MPGNLDIVVEARLPPGPAERVYTDNAGSRMREDILKEPERRPSLEYSDFEEMYVRLTNETLKTPLPDRLVRRCVVIGKFGAHGVSQSPTKAIVPYLFDGVL